MKKYTLIFLFAAFGLIAASARITPDEMNDINRRLDIILRVSRRVPASERGLIMSNVRVIKRLLALEADRNENDRGRDKLVNKDIPNRDIKVDRVEVDGVDRRDDRLDRRDLDNKVLRTYDDREVQDLSKRIKEAWPFKDQILMINRFGKTSSFSIRQILELIKVIDFPKDQKEAVLVLLPNAYDPENVDLLYQLFWTSDDRKRVNSVVDR